MHPILVAALAGLSAYLILGNEGLGLLESYQAGASLSGSGPSLFSVNSYQNMASKFANSTRGMTPFHLILVSLLSFLVGGLTFLSASSAFRRMSGELTLGKQIRSSRERTRGEVYLLYQYTVSSGHEEAFKAAFDSLGHYLSTNSGIVSVSLYDAIEPDSTHKMVAIQLTHPDVLTKISTTLRFRELNSEVARHASFVPCLYRVGGRWLAGQYRDDHQEPFCPHNAPGNVAPSHYQLHRQTNDSCKPM